VNTANEILFVWQKAIVDIRHWKFFYSQLHKSVHICFIANLIFTIGVRAPSYNNAKGCRTEWVWHNSRHGCKKSVEIKFISVELAFYEKYMTFLVLYLFASYMLRFIEN